MATLAATAGSLAARLRRSDGAPGTHLASTASVSRHRLPQRRRPRGVGVGAAGERLRHDHLHPWCHPDLAARTPEDVLAAVPVVLGFVPEESVVMLTFGAEHPFHARLDLPVTAAECQEAAEALVGPAVRHGVRSVLFVLYADDPARASSCATHAGAHLHRRGHRRRRRAAQRRPVLVRGPASTARPARRPAPPTTCPATSSPPRPSPPGGSRAPRAPSWPRPSRPTRRRRAAVAEAAQEAAAARPRSPRERRCGPTVGRWAAGLGPPDPATSARLLVALRDAEVRDAVLSPVDRAERGAAAARLVGAGQVRAGRPGGPGRRRCWPSSRGWPATVRWPGARSSGPTRATRPARLADRVAEALEQALPPAVWEQRR